MPCNDCSRAENCPPCVNETCAEGYRRAQCVPMHTDDCPYTDPGPESRWTKELRDDLRQGRAEDSEGLSERAWHLMCRCRHVQGYHRPAMKGGCIHCVCDGFKLEQEPCQEEPEKVCDCGHEVAHLESECGGEEEPFRAGRTERQRAILDSAGNCGSCDAPTGGKRDDLWRSIQDAVYEFREMTTLWGESDGVTEGIADAVRKAIKAPDDSHEAPMRLPRRPPYAVAYSVEGQLHELLLPGGAAVAAEDGMLKVFHEGQSILGIVRTMPVKERSADGA